MKKEIQYTEEQGHGFIAFDIMKRYTIKILLIVTPIALALEYYSIIF